MKKLKIILFSFVTVLALVGCETYQDPKIEYTAVSQISGQWLVRFIKPNATVTADTTDYCIVNTFNTATNVSDSIWVRKTAYDYIPTSSFIANFTVKAKCDVPSLAFNIDNGVNTVLASGVSVGTITITEGKIIKDGWDTASGHKSDKITFKLVDSRKGNIIYTAEGYKRTGWWPDEPYFDDIKN